MKFTPDYDSRISKLQLERIVKNITDARYKILVALRPLTNARPAFNFALQAVADSFDREEDKRAIMALKLED